MRLEVGRVAQLLAKRQCDSSACRTVAPIVGVHRVDELHDGKFGGAAVWRGTLRVEDDLLRVEPSVGEK